MSASLIGRLGSSTFRSRSAPHYIAFLDDQVIVLIDLDLGAGPLAEQHAVAGFELSLCYLQLQFALQ